MADVTLIANGSYFIHSFTNYYLGAIAHGALAPNNSATEDLAPFHTAGTLSRFRAHITANTAVSTTFTLHTRHASGLGAQFVTILPGTTGIFEDLTNTDTVTPSGSPSVQLWGYQSTYTGTSAGTGITIAQLSVVYTRSGYETPISFRQISSSALSGSRAITGTNTHSSTESEIGLPIYDAGTCRNASVYIAANTRASSTTITLRKNFVDTAVVITIGAGATGWFYDTSNTASVAKNDILTWVTSSVVGLFAGSHLGFEFVASTAAIPYRIGLGSVSGGNISGSSFTTYLHAGGSLNQSSTASDWQSSSGEAFTVIGMRVYVTGSTIGTTATTFTLQVNGVDTAGVLTIPAVSPAVGWHSVSVTVPVLASDFIGLKYVALSTPPVISSVVLEPIETPIPSGERHLLLGQNHTVGAGASDLLLVGIGNTVSDDVSQGHGEGSTVEGHHTVHFNLTAAPNTVTTDRTFQVDADIINLNGTVEVNGAPIGGVDIDDIVSRLLVTEDGALVLDEDGVPLYSE